MGIAGAITMNSARLLVTCWIETVCRLLFVMVIVAAVLVEPTVSDPKLTAVGVTPTPA